MADFLHALKGEAFRPLNPQLCKELGVGVGVGDGCWVGVSPVEDGVGDGVGTEDEVVFFSINLITTIAATEL